MAINKSKILDIIDVQSQTIRETEIDHNKPIELDENLAPYPRDRKGRITVDHEQVELTEAGGEMSTANFPDALRVGLRYDAFTGFNETPVTWDQIASVSTSNKQMEEWKDGVGMGLLPRVDEGQPYPQTAAGDGPGIQITNHKYGMILPVTEEMQKFDQIGQVREQAVLMGRAARLTEEQAVLDVLTTTANYTRSNTAGDNDESATGGGANTQTLTLSPTGLIAAFNILRTMKDRHSGMYLNVMPDTLVITPKLEWYVRQLLSSTQVMGAGDTDAVIVYGQGTQNPFFSVVRRVIVTPQFGNGYQWALLESNRAIKFQRVENLEVRMENQMTSDVYFERDVLRYRVRTWFGTGMRDDRFAFYSDSTTAPTVN